MPGRGAAAGAAEVPGAGLLPQATTQATAPSPRQAPEYHGESSPMYFRSSSTYTLAAFLRLRELSETGRVESAGGSEAIARRIGTPFSTAARMSVCSPLR